MKLEAAKNSVLKDNPKAAVNKLNATIHSLFALKKSRRPDAVVADSLVGEIQDMISSLPA